MNSFGSSTKVFINNQEAFKFDDNNFIHFFAQNERSGLVDLRIENSSWSTTLKVRANIDNSSNLANCQNEIIDSSIGKTSSNTNACFFDQVVIKFPSNPQEPEEVVEES